jgi:hypothetical protein
MRKTILSVAVAGALTFGGAAHAGLTLDLNGGAAGGVITADALDWAPTSFLAQGGNSAITAFESGACANTPTACQFDVLTMAKLTGYLPTGSNQFVGLPSGVGEITLVAQFTEQVVNTTGGAFPSATFATTGAGYVEFYWSATADSDPLTGSNFDNGTLIGRLTGVAPSIGTFLVTDTTPVNLDQTADGNQYTGQLTVSGTGSQGLLTAGTTSKELDPSFFLTSLSQFIIHFENISIGLPYTSVNPADCFNDVPNADPVGTGGQTTTCNTVHVNGPYSAQNPADPGYLPVVGPVNGLGIGAPDFVAQTDFNSSVNGGRIPEPASLGLLGLGLAALGWSARRKQR